MKKKLISVLLATTILSGGVAAAADQDKPTAGADAAFKSLDKDADQRLSKTEAAIDQMLKEHFAAIDADGDGYLSTREYTAHMKEMAGEK